MVGLIAVSINTFNFPFWEIYLNQKKLEKNRDFLLNIDIKKGKNKCILKFQLPLILIVIFALQIILIVGVYCGIKNISHRSNTA